MSTIVITKGKLLKDSVEINYIKRDKDNSSATCEEEHKAPPHADLKSAFASLAIHAAVINEFIDSSAIADIENPEHPQLEKFIITGFTIQGGEDMKGVVLSAQKLLSNGAQFGFNTRPISFNEESPNAYEHLTPLLQAIENCRHQLKLYLGGRHGADVQPKLPFEKDDDAENNSDELEPGETNDAIENKRIKAGKAGAAQKGKSKKIKEEAEA